MPHPPPLGGISTSPAHKRQGLAPCSRSGGFILRHRIAISLAIWAALAAWTAVANAKTASSKAFILPRWWLSEALCIHRHESTDWHRTTDWLGRPSVNHGGMQINVATWGRWAPRGFPDEPAAASPREQLIVAYRIWTANGRRFGGGQWPYSSMACHVD